MTSLPHGYFLLYKPRGISSFKAVSFARDSLAKHSGVKFRNIKIGHSGTLDPLASGLLLCAVGAGTKMLSHLILSQKTYTANITLGKFSETDDSEGEKFDHEKKRVDIPAQEEIENTLTRFIGIIEQLSPKYSALKINGKRSCDRIRKGQEVFQKIREVEIINIKLLEYSYPSLKIHVHCGSGTYIRSLARDIGEKLKTGGYIEELERTSIGKYNCKNLKHPKEILPEDIKFFTPEDINLESIAISEENYGDLLKGRRLVFFDESSKIPNGELGLYIAKNKRIIGFGEKDNHILRPRTMMSI